MFSSLRAHLASQLETIRAEGLWKGERLLASAQGARIAVQGREVLNLCANNYLGLANHPEIVAAAKAGLDRWGYGLSSVRFICGTQEIHKELERTLSEFLGTEDTILYSSCFDANGGFFEALLSEQDAIVSDELNHASIIDGVRLCRAQRFRYRNGDLADLEARLSEARECPLPRHRHRRRLLHGWRHGAAGRDLRPGRAIRGPRAWWTIPTRPVSSARADAEPTSRRV